MSPSPLLPLIVTAVFAAGLFVITRLEKWADLVGGILGLTAVGLLCLLLLAVTPPAPSGPNPARGRPGVPVSMMAGADLGWPARP
ncbi:hypothetical protein M446_0588 [Methylobacterium sp. 4-46]|uniref:hypothetical protein n=1 Tax=unclassified Methylobacterium TaxID=2615210 RepID=UPI000152CB59|nr:MULTISPECIES: hypothetical protein [Methylobacterium]ACA15149.1 hypothetical protein M446_0588 [Methylobacterium sp. 4-46]WFT80883.1 hypothetical protein QA634_02980 [Methylobacterium nodulans]